MRSFVLAPLLLLVAFLAGMPRATAQCVDPAPLRTGDVINIALLVWVDAPHGLFTGNLSDTTSGGDNKIAAAFVQPHLLGLELYVNAMRARGGVLPLPNGESVQLNFVYINLSAHTTRVPTVAGFCALAWVCSSLIVVCSPSAAEPTLLFRPACPTPTAVVCSLPSGRSGITTRA